MNHAQTIICGLAGFFVCWFSIHLILSRSIWFRALMAQRQFHQTHTTPIPRFGGVALAAAFVTVAVAALVLITQGPSGIRESVAIMVCSLAMFGLGFADDLRPLGAKIKLLGQIIIAGGVCLGGLEIAQLKNPFTNTVHQLGIFAVPVTIFWLVALTNLINLVDGIDGLAGGIGFMMMCLLAYLGVHTQASFTIVVAIGMAGALLGFLYFNFPPAKIYMGDGGAYLVGFLIGTLAISNSNKGTVAVALLAPTVALALPIIDVALAIARRGVRGLPIFRPDKKHIHHRLAELGLSPLKVVLILYGLSFLFLVMGFLVFWSEGRMLPVFVGFAALAVVVGIRMMGWIRNWLEVRHMVGGAGEMRRRVRYALAMSDWLDLGAEHAGTPDELWENFAFGAQRLGFCRVLLRQGESERSVTCANFAAEKFDLTDQHQINADVASFDLEFIGNSAVEEPKTFFLLSELAAEAWLRAARRWQRTHNRAIQFTPQPPAK
ncbi:MAG TPA: MraY family glycosyltransferase [Verrucomicrobiae bacterium]